VCIPETDTLMSRKVGKGRRRRGKKELVRKKRNKAEGPTTVKGKMNISARVVR